MIPGEILRHKRLLISVDLVASKKILQKSVDNKGTQNIHLPNY